MKIRPATPQDAEAIVDMASRFYARTHYPRSIPMDETSVAALAAMLRDTGIMLVATVDERVVGMIALVIAPFPFNFAHKSANEVAFWLDEGVRGGRGALALLQHAEACAVVAGCTVIQMMHMHDSPPAAARLYEHSGYFLSEVAWTKEL